MVDRRQVNGRYDPWSFTTKSVEYARNNDVHTIRRILQSDAFREAPASRKFILLKAIVKDFGCVRSICGLLQRHVFCNVRSGAGGSSTAMRPDMVDSQGSSLAHWAAQNSDPTPVLKILRDLGCPLKAVNKAGMSPLHYLFWKNCPSDDFRLREAARFLKSSGCLVDLRDRIGETVFHVACLRKNPLSAFRVLKDLGANLHMKTAKQESALHLVAASCDPVFLVSAFEFLINEGVEVSGRDDADKTALYYISERKKIDPELRSQIIGLIRPVAAHHHFTGSDVNSDTDSLLSPQTSSGFSEKLSLDDLPGTPESGSAFRHFAVPDCVTSRHSRSHSSTSTNSARFSPYEPRRPRSRQHRSTQDLYSLSTSSYSPGGVTSPVHAFVPIHPPTHQPMPAQTTLPTPIPSTSRAPSNISNIASSSKSNNALALTNALHPPPPPPPTPQHAQHDAQTSTDDITQASRCLPMSPVTIIPGAVHREAMSPRCRLWRMGELENALPRTVSDSGHIVVNQNGNPAGICTCNRCQRESLDRSRLEELERTVQNLTRQNADMRQQFDDLQQKNQSIRERAQRIETCEICSFPYSENEEASNRCTFRKCGHICCAECVQQTLSLAQSGENNEPPRCPFHSCRTPFSSDDVVTLKL